MTTFNTFDFNLDSQNSNHILNNFVHFSIHIYHLSYPVSFKINYSIIFKINYSIIFKIYTYQIWLIFDTRIVFVHHRLWALFVGTMELPSEVIPCLREMILFSRLMHLFQVHMMQIPLKFEHLDWLHQQGQATRPQHLWQY